jgi:uncharacterized protein YecT (DUF1311 family)
LKTILAAAAVATAVQMMPPGPSPESGFKGLWRIVEARPAPWAHGVSKAPLLEYAVAFADGKVSGPAPLACAKARYSSGVTYADGLFGGKLQGPDELAAAKRLNLSSGQPSTYRVLCGDAVRDYYFDDHADMTMAEGDVIYTLQRPTGMDPEQYKPGYSGPSFDCAEARTAGERTICRDAELSKADRELAAAFARLRATETTDSFATVEAAQGAWLAYVHKACKANGALPKDTEARNDLRDCLDENYTDRAAALDGPKPARAGTLVIEPRALFFSRPKPPTDESDLYPWMTGGDAAAPFNAWVAKQLQLDKRRIDDKSRFARDEKDLLPGLQLYSRSLYEVSRFDAKVVSVRVWTNDFLGGAHEAHNAQALDWDMRRRRPFGPKEVFKDGWRKFATDYCLHDLADQVPDGFDRGEVDAVVGEGDWLFANHHVTIHFEAYAAGEIDVDIPYTALKPYLKPDAPVP